MKLTAGVQTYDIPRGEDAMAVFLPGTVAKYSLTRTSMDFIFGRDGNIQGFPTYFAYACGKMMFWPTPDKEYNIEVYMLERVIL